MMTMYPCVRKLVVAMLLMAALLALLAGVAVAGPVGVAWNLVTTTVSDGPIPPALANDLRYQVWSRPFGGETNWTVRAVTTANVDRIWFDMPMGVWHLGVTASFLGHEWTRSSAMSSNLEHRVYGRVVHVGGTTLLVVGE